MNIKIAIADDHHLIAEGIQNMLRYSSEMEVVACYANGETLMKGLKEICPDVLLLDIQMPGKQGDELAEMIRHTYPGIKILVLTNQDNYFYINSMLQQGVDGYVLKNIQKTELVSAIISVYSGNKYFDPIIFDRIEEEERERKRIEANAAKLSRRENEILKLMAQDMTATEIADQLHLSRRTIEHHRESILSKLDVKSTLAMVRKAKDMGLLE